MQNLYEERLAIKDSPFTCQSKVCVHDAINRSLCNVRHLQHSFNQTHLQADARRFHHFSLNTLLKMYINKTKTCLYYCHKPPLMFLVFFFFQYIATRKKAPVDSSSTVCCKGHWMKSNWNTLTLPWTGGQTTFLLRSERPFSHYAAALIYRNTKIRLNGAIFSFAFGGHFSCLENSSHSNGTRGSTVIIACSVKVQKLGLQSLEVTYGPQLELTLHRTSSCVAVD